jgi:hypothetical protein
MRRAVSGPSCQIGSRVFSRVGVSIAPTGSDRRGQYAKWENTAFIAVRSTRSTENRLAIDLYPDRSGGHPCDGGISLRGLTTPGILSVRHGSGKLGRLVRHGDTIGKIDHDSQVPARWRRIAGVRMETPFGGRQSIPAKAAHRHCPLPVLWWLAIWPTASASDKSRWHW